MSEGNVRTGDMADRGDTAVDRRGIFVIRDEVEVQQGDAERSSFESPIERLLDIEQLLVNGLYRITVLVESVVDEGEAYVSYGPTARTESTGRWLESQTDTRDAGIRRGWVREGGTDRRPLRTVAPADGRRPDRC